MGAFNSSEEKPVINNQQCVDHLYKELKREPLFYPDITLTSLDKQDIRYLEMQEQIKNIQPKIQHKYFKRLQLVSIQEINNKYLETLYELKKREHNISEITDMYHGTSMSQVESIYRNNFDYRICKRGKFGKGVSFSRRLSYALNYCDPNDCFKCIILCKILSSNASIGDEYTIYPAGWSDSTRSVNGDVIVKYDDDVFLPKYIVNFKTLNY